MGLLDLPAAAADAKTAVGPAHNLHRFRQPVTQAVARGSDLSSRRLIVTVRLSVGRATDSHVAGTGHQVRSPASNPLEHLCQLPSPGHDAHGLRVLARRTHAQDQPRPPESESVTLVDHLHLKSPAHADFFGTRVCSVAGSWLGMRAWAGGRAHVGAVERSSLAIYSSAYGLHGCT